MGFIPVMMPMAGRSGAGAAMGYLVGFILCAAFALVFWGIRPFAVPRHGEWEGDKYVIHGVIEGNVTCWNQNDCSAYDDPPIWVGVGTYKQFNNEQDAKKQVEWDCQ